MNAENNHGHPHLETLLAYADGALSAEAAEAAEAAAHLEGCAACRLEVKRFQRFVVMGEDPQEDSEAQWHQAELQLERAWQEKSKPALPTAAGPPWRWVWLVPAAAAAVTAFFFLQPTAPQAPGPHGAPATHAAPGSAVVRGGNDLGDPEIALQAPSGELKELPRQFVWKTDQECASFTLMVFTADLKQVFSRPGITTSEWEVGEELERLLEPQTIYLWSVRGYRELRVVAESENGWFKLVP